MRATKAWLMRYPLRIVTTDLQSAEAAFTFSIRMGRPFETASSLAAMACLHGEGEQTWWEGGEYKVAYRKEVAHGSWEISRLEYETLSLADHRSGRSYAQPISVSRFAMRFPEDQQGPYALV